MNSIIDTAWAQGAPAGGSDPLLSFLPLVIIFVLFYFLLIRPQSKRQKEHRQMVEGLSTGDEVVTGGGVLGTVKEVSDQFVTVEVADGVALKIQRHTVSAVVPRGTIKNV